MIEDTVVQPNPSQREQAHALAIDKLRGARNYILLIPNENGMPEGHFDCPNLGWMYAAYLTVARGLGQAYQAHTAAEEEEEA